jgi:hypothetical protein
LAALEHAFSAADLIAAMAKGVAKIKAGKIKDFRFNTLELPKASAE